MVMKRARLDGVELEYEVKGEGDPVLLIHGSHIGGSFVPLISQPALTEDYLLIRYHRRGFGNSSPTRGKLSVIEQADDARALLEYLKIGPAHVVGHSYGGPIALQLAADCPQAVHTLALLEAALLTVPGGEQVRELVAAAGKLYHNGEWEAAEDLFLGSPGSVLISPAPSLGVWNRHCATWTPTSSPRPRPTTSGCSGQPRRAGSAAPCFS